MALRQLTEDESVIFLHLKLIEKDSDSDELFRQISNAPSSWVLKAVEKRFSAHNFKADKKTMIMILAIGDGTVGRCAKYVDDVVERCKSQGLDSVDFETFSTKIYPGGIPDFDNKNCNG